MSWAQVGVVAAVVGAVCALLFIPLAIYLDRGNARRGRISGVVGEYGRLCYGHPRINCGPTAFLQAGARLLKSDDEVLEAVSAIEARWGRGGGHPWGGFRAQIPPGTKLKTEILDRLDQDGSNYAEVVRGLIGKL